MGTSKINLFTDEQNLVAKIAKALAHPARVAILEHVLSTNACINNDLVNELGLAQATISQHLKELKNIGLIKGTIEGTSMSYCINSENWEASKEILNSLFNKYHATCSGDSCC